MHESSALPRRIAEVARRLQDETGSTPTMDLAVHLAVETVAGAEEASISLVHRGHIVETPVATSDRARKVDLTQYEFGNGPLIADIWHTEVVSCTDLAADTRWGDWGPTAARQSGIRSLLAFRMFAASHQLGALTVYSSEPHAFVGADVETGVAFAAHTAIAIGVARTDEHKDIAMDSRSTIGQATGMLMERYNVDAVRAFAALRRLSQDNNLKLHDIAIQLCDTRKLPPTP